MFTPEKSLLKSKYTFLPGITKKDFLNMFKYLFLIICSQKLFPIISRSLSCSSRARLTEARVQVWFSNRRARLRKHLNSQQLATLTSPMAPSAAAAAAAASAAAASPYMAHHQYPGQMCDPAAYHGE